MSITGRPVKARSGRSGPPQYSPLPGLRYEEHRIVAIGLMDFPSHGRPDLVKDSHSCSRLQQLVQMRFTDPSAATNLWLMARRLSTTHRSRCSLRLALEGKSIVLSQTWQ